MFDGMMNPELMRLAQEQMSRMSPADFTRIQQQMMSNPDLMKMATESMKNMRPEDLRQAAEQLKHTRPEEMTEIGEKMAKVSREDLAAMRAHVDARSTYQMNAAQMLKNQGNELHSQGRFSDAAQKYMLAKKNLKDISSSKGRAFSVVCSLNLMSCYLKTKQYDDCIKEGYEVLASDARNVKALYRRGQAYKEIGQLEDAVSDLSKAHEVSPDDETIADVLRDSKERLAREGSHCHGASKGLVIEEITEEDEVVTSKENQIYPANTSVTQPEESTDCSENISRANNQGVATSAECLKALKDDPEAIRSFQNFISRADPNTLAAMSGEKPGEMSPDMFKTASNMISKMSPEDIQKMVHLASSFHGDNTFSSRPSVENGFKSTPDMLKLASDMMNKMSSEEREMFQKIQGDNPFSSGPSVENGVKSTPDMLKLASDMMNKMTPEEREKMFEMASSLNANASVPQSSAALHTDRQRSYTDTEPSEPRENVADGSVGEASSSSSSFMNSRSVGQSNVPTPPAGLQEQIRNQMTDPAMRQMFSSLVKNMSPDMMANMSEQFGFKLSREDAAKAQQAMSSLSPEDLDKMMRWADKVQRGVENTRRAKKWLLGKGGLIMAICMLILALILHRLGYIGG